MNLEIPNNLNCGNQILDTLKALSLYKLQTKLKSIALASFETIVLTQSYVVEYSNGEDFIFSIIKDFSIKLKLNTGQFRETLKALILALGLFASDNRNALGMIDIFNSIYQKLIEIRISSAILTIPHDFECIKRILQILNALERLISPDDLIQLRIEIQQSENIIYCVVCRGRKKLFTLTIDVYKLVFIRFCRIPFYEPYDKVFFEAHNIFQI